MLFCKVLSEYPGYTLETLLDAPIRHFWFLVNMIERLRAEKDLRQIQLLAAVGGPEAYKSMTDRLQKDMGQIYVVETDTPKEIKIDPVTGLDPEFDREGLRALKMRIQSAR